VARRVFELAKELGVKSTAIVSKCQAEGIDIKNHMSTLSAGLEATIHEWFTCDDGTVATTVETTAPVDLEKVKTKKLRQQKKKATVSSESAAVVTMVESIAETEDQGQLADVIEPKVIAPSIPPKQAAKPAASKRPKRKSPKELEAEDKSVESLEPVETPEKAAVLPKEEVSEKVPREKKAAPEELPPKPPEPFVPAPAVLQGPRVIRTDPVEIVSVPPSRAPRKKASPRPAAEVFLPDPIYEKEAPIGTRRRRKGKGTKIEQEESDLKPGKQRALHRSSGRRYESVSDLPGPHEWGDRDLQEREQRLAQASGTQLHRRERRLSHVEKGSSGVTMLIEPHRIEKATVEEPVTVKILSSVIGIRANEIIAKLMETGVMASINHVLDAESAMMVALEFGVDLTVERRTLLWDRLLGNFDNEVLSEQQGPRPPVVAFLGHVDHGKTSLLDRIRKESVVAGEAGGITQHIGSYLYDDGRHRVALLDTPGHKAFTEMRARGANMTDVLVLVVAADDGVMPQTIEAINHAKAAEVPIVVALNKMDLPGVDENRVLGQLSERGLVPAEWGGDTEVVRTSAVTGQGIEDLMEHLEYVAELRHLTASNQGSATGWVVEAEMTIKQGAEARLLVRSGKLKPGNILVSGCSYGRIRTMMDATGRNIKEAGPSTPVAITGLNKIPIAGDRFCVVESISQAAEIASEQEDYRREKALAQRRQVTLDNLFSEIAAGELKEFNVIVKADVQGSVDVLRDTIMEMNTSEVAVRILHSAVGGITESDVLLAQASNAIIIGFQVIADEHARNIAEKEGVEIRLYRIIYQISDDIKKALEGLLKPRIEEKPLGRAEVRQIFRVSRMGVIAGCLVTNGSISRSARLRVIRDNVVIRDNSSVESLRRIKDDASEVRSGLECGIKLAGFDDLKIGDLIEAYELVEISRTLDPVE